MRITVRPHAAQHEDAVREFNRRLDEGGSDKQFPESPVPGWLPPGPHPTLYNEIFLAFDDDAVVRGGYLLKHQEFLIDGRVERIANYAFPLSEGVVDRRYGMVGVSMILDAQKRQPLLFGLGMGGTDHPSARVMKGVGWSATMVPFFFRVVRPFRFLRNIAFLRRSTLRRLALDTAAFTGLGWAGMRFLDLAARTSVATGAEGEEVDGFGDWADEVWQASAFPGGLCAVRDRATLDTLYPAGSERFIVVRVSQAARTIGWAVCLDTRMSGHAYFGDMRVGTVADCLAIPSHETAVLEVADRILRRRGVELIVSNQSHTAWCNAFRNMGYRQGPSNFAFTASRQLAERVGGLDDAISRSHLNRGDGDGPINL